MSYWTEHDPPMSFIPEGWTYEQKKEFRFKCIPYLWWELAKREWEGKRVLCVGDGSGIDAVEIAKFGAHVTVVDLSEKAIELSLRHAEEADVINRFRAGVADATNLANVEHASYHILGFDVVYSFGVIHHIPNVESAVREICRVLRPGGKFTGMVYNRDSLLYAYSILKRGEDEGLSPAEAMRQYSERNPGCPHSVAYTKQELVNLFRARCGFSTCEVETRYDVIDLPNKRKTPFHIEGVSDLGWHLFFEATK